jgi:hypothetical protein
MLFLEPHSRLSLVGDFVDPRSSDSVSISQIGGTPKMCKHYWGPRLLDTNGFVNLSRETHCEPSSSQEQYHQETY